MKDIQTKFHEAVHVAETVFSQEVGAAMQKRADAVRKAAEDHDAEFDRRMAVLQTGEGVTVRGRPFDLDAAVGIGADAVSREMALEPFPSVVTGDRREAA